MRAVLLVVPLLTLILSGCLGGGPDPVPGPEPAVEPLPAGCDGDRTAIAHRDGQPLPDPKDPAVHGCLYRTGGRTLEPTIGITSDGTVFIGPGSQPIAGAAPVYGVWRSQDEGQTWEVLIPDAAGVPTHPTTQDPYLFVDPVTDRVFAEDLVVPPFNCGSISWTDDEGGTWDNSLAGCLQTDHVTIFTGTPVTSTTSGYPNIVYRCAIAGGALAGFSTMVNCQRSLDGGRLWQPPGEPPFVFPPGVLMGTPANGCSGGNGHGATDAEGRVYLPRGHCGQPWLAISDDEALTWKTVQIADTGMMCNASICEHDAGVGVDPNGTIYYAWVAGDRLPYLSLSHDGGDTWSEPRMIGLPGLVEASHLQLIVGGTGRVAFVYLGSTNSPGAPFEGDYSEVTWGGYIGATLDADRQDVTFQTVTLNETGDPFIRGRCGPLRCQAVFDFIDIRIAPDGTAWVPLVDGCNGPCATGEQMSASGAEAVAGRMVGLDLWGPEDPNGPYSGP